VKDRVTKEPADKLRDHIVDLAFTHGLLLLGCGKSVIRIAPPLCVNQAEVDEALSILDEVITMSEREALRVAA
jgi:4-aminobutyrate aminotransferase